MAGAAGVAGVEARSESNLDGGQGVAAPPAAQGDLVRDHLDAAVTKSRGVTIYRISRLESACRISYGSSVSALASWHYRPRYEAVK